MSEDQKPYTVEEVALQLGVTPVTIRRLIRDRQITAERPGQRKWIITREALDIYRKSIRSEAIRKPASSETSPPEGHRRSGAGD
jgi:excisionase family DNA binding protein